MNLTRLALGWVLPLTTAFAQDAPALLQSMAGTWAVEQRMWPAAGAKAVVLPAAIAHRRLIDGKFLEESMQPSTVAPGQAGYFVRNATLNYNAVSKQYEYFSIDTRAPQTMMETSSPTEEPNDSKELRLAGGTFTAPEWGDAKNVRFKYRLLVGPVQDGRQTVALFLTPLAVLPNREFVAFEYKYVRQKLDAPVPDGAASGPK